MNHKLQASMTYCPIPEWKCGYWNVLLNNEISFKSLCLEQETKAKNQNCEIRTQSVQRAKHGDCSQQQAWSTIPKPGLSSGTLAVRTEGEWVYQVEAVNKYLGRERGLQR